MTKNEAKVIFGGTQNSIAQALGVHYITVSKWPDPLPQKIEDQIVGAAIRLNKIEIDVKNYPNISFLKK